MIDQDDYDDGYSDPTDNIDEIELGFRRYMYFLHEEYLGHSIPVVEESFCRGVEHYLFELNPKITEKNLKNFHLKLFNKCNQMMMCNTFSVPEKMKEPIRLALIG
jgi:hypothetical protein